MGNRLFDDALGNNNHLCAVMDPGDIKELHKLVETLFLLVNKVFIWHADILKIQLSSMRGPHF